MTSFVFDTGAISLFFAEDERLRRLVASIHEGKDEGSLSSVTLAEFYYKTCQRLGREVASLWSMQLSERIDVIAADIELSTGAGLERCRNSGLSLADCYALALAKRLHGLLLTTDSELAKTKGANVRFFDV